MKDCLDSAQKDAVKANRFVFTLADGKFGAGEKMKNSNYWKPYASDTSFDPTDGAQKVTLVKNNAGIQNIKAGGAMFMAYQYVDADGRTGDAGYVGFAEDPNATSEDSAYALTATAALAMAAATLF